MKTLKLILRIVASLIICILLFGFWLSYEFKLALGKGRTAAIENKQAISVSPSPSTYVLKNGQGQLVEVNIRVLALDAWRADKLLPGKDGKYNWFEIGLAIGLWKDYFRDHAIIVDDKAFTAAYNAIARRSEAHLKDQAFQASQE